MIAGRYTLDREIGRGGMGAVWLGRDVVLDRPVAIKRVGVMPGGTSPDLLRAEREARIAASLNHPHIVGIFDLVAEDEQQWMVMEYVEGTSLAELIRERGPLDPGEAASLLSQAASALAAAHASQIVHRDVKPSNILVRADGHVKLSDFGIARAEADASLTQTGLVTGSPAYLAPEVASGQLASPASDVWSLGATLFHTLSGRQPYEMGDNVLGGLYRIVNEEPPRLPDHPELAQVLAATMVRDPAARWSMSEVTGALESFARDAPAVSVAAPPGQHAETSATQSTAPPTVAAAPVPAPTAAVGAAAVPQQARASSRRRRGTPVLPVLVTLVVAALIVVIVLLALSNDPQDLGDQGVPTPTTSSSPSSSSDTPQTPSQSATPEGPTRADLVDFGRTYVQTAVADPDAGFGLLTPAYQRASPEYDQFWGSISSARVLDISADVNDLTVSYRYTYQQDAGPRTENVTLQLVRDGDGFLIDGAS